MPGQGVVSMFNFGHNLGYIEGLLQAFDIPYQLVPPQTWKKEFCVTSDKNTSIEVCRKLFPHVSLLPTAKVVNPATEWLRLCSWRNTRGGDSNG